MIPAAMQAKAAFDAALQAVFADAHGSPVDIRTRAAKAVATVLAEARAGVKADFEALKISGLKAGEGLAAIQDSAIALLFETAAGRIHKLMIPTSGERMAVVAVGGYGRGVLAPGSDIDLLFLTPYKQTPWGESVIETVLYALWDMRLKVGHASRSVDDCVRLARDDMTIRTSLLETRFLCGDRALYEEMRARLWDELFSRTGPEFVAAKLEERKTRHERAGGSRYLLEPNIKESKGGLRDLQSLFWIAKYLYHTEKSDAPATKGVFGDLVAQGVFSAADARRFARSEEFMWTVRFWLHYLAGGRAQEQLTFDAQLEIANRMRFRATEGRRAVERFMKRYFIAAKNVGDLTRVFCAALEEQQKVERADVESGRRRFFGLLPPRRTRPGEAALRLEKGRLLAEDGGAFAANPLEILRFFKTVSETGLPAHPSALKQIRASLRLIDPKLRADPRARALFLEILAPERGDPESALKQMNEIGALGRFLPEFNWIVAMMQFNMYHHYTVDEHTLTAIGVLSRIERGELTKDHPLAAEIMAEGVNRRVLYTALLLHDIGKGKPEDHCIVGERVARDVCPRLGLDDSETERVAWLVRQHLLMSDVAQKRDLSDARTIRGFADIVQSRERLRLLLCLTVADIRAVGPNVWNGWKAQLLRDLYRETEALLTGGHAPGETRAARVQASKLALRERLADWPTAETEAFVERHYPAYWLGLDAETHEAHARMLAEDAYETTAAGDQRFLIRLHADPRRSATRLYVSMDDHPGIFARMTGAIALAGANVLDAKSFTTSDGVALNTFWLQNAEGQPYDDPARVERLRRSIWRTLKGELRLRDEIKARRRVKKREEGFVVPPSVVFDNAASELYTLIEVTGRDRLGLLYDLARAFTAENLNIFSAVIATYGERAVDAFYVKDLYGHKVDQPERLRRIEQRLKAVLAMEKA